MSEHPYKSLPARQYWRRGIAGWSERRYTDLFRPRFPIDRKTRIATAGSCFAQHIGRQFKARGFNYQDFEPAPSGLNDELRTAYGYGMFSCRYGNIYTSRQLLQLIKRSSGSFSPESVWEQNGRFYDPFRPSIEPTGFSSREELLALREDHYRAVRQMVKQTDVFVFTLGLTEVWLNRLDGVAYPTCPGTVAGEFDSDLHVFTNLSFMEILNDMERIISWMRRKNPSLRFLLTVSPVPLAATATDAHIVTATTYSKSVLRAVAGELYRRHTFVDYFPSYEIVTAPPSHGEHYQPGMRDVSAEGVESVMSCFFEAHGEDHLPPIAPKVSSSNSARDASRAHDANAIREMGIICDEENLDPIVVNT